MPKPRNDRKAPKPVAPTTRKLRVALGGLLIAVVTVAAYLPAMHGGFIWDDDDYITENQCLRTWEGLPRIWLSPLSIPQYYPMTHTTFWIEYRFWSTDPLGYHIDNVILHACNALLVWWLLRRLKIPGAFLAAMIFALHPVHVESVAWVTERKNTLSALFYLLAFHAYLRTGLMLDTAPVRWKWYAVALLAFVAALLSKSVTASLPAAILIVTWWKVGRIRLRDVAPLLPMFVLGLAMGSVTGWIERHHVGATGPDYQIAFVSRIVIATRAVWFYIGKLLIPANLTFIYPRWVINPADAIQWTGAAALALAMTAAFVLRRRWPGLLAAALFFLVTLSPALGFVNIYPMKYSFVADHFQYLASLGLIVPLAALVSLAPGFLDERARTRAASFTGPAKASNRDRWTAVLVAIVLCGLGTLTYRRGLVFHDAQTLWGDTLTRNPSAWMAHTNLAIKCSDSGALDEAISHLRIADQLRPNDRTILVGLGHALAKTGQFDEGIARIRAAIATAPGEDDGYFTLGLVHTMMDRHEEAIADFRAAIQRAPDHANNHVNLGVALARSNRHREAVTEYEAALRLDPGLFDAQYNLGISRMQLADSNGARVAFEAAQTSAPADPRPHLGLGIVLLQSRRPNEALDEFKAALALDPSSPDALANMGQACEALSDPGSAMKWYRRGLTIDPRNQICLEGFQRTAHARTR